MSTNAADVARRISTILGWTLKHNSESDRDTHAKIVRADGLTLSVISGGNWAPLGKIHISFSRPRDAKGEYIYVSDSDMGLDTKGQFNDPSINVSENKTAQQIVADIERRLLPDASKLFEIVQNRIAKWNENRRKTAANVQAVAEAAKGPGYVADKWEHESGRVSLTGLAEVRVSSESVTIELWSMPLDKALAVIAFLKSEVATTKQTEAI